MAVDCGSVPATVTRHYEQAYVLSEEQAIVTLGVDIPFGLQGNERRIVPTEWAERIAKEFRSIGEPAPTDLHDKTGLFRGSYLDGDEREQL